MPVQTPAPQPAEPSAEGLNLPPTVYPDAEGIDFFACIGMRKLSPGIDAIPRIPNVLEFE